MPVTARTIVLAARPDGKPRANAISAWNSAVLPGPAPVRCAADALAVARPLHARDGCRTGRLMLAATELGQPLPAEAVARVC